VCCSPTENEDHHRYALPACAFVRDLDSCR